MMRFRFRTMLLGVLMGVSPSAFAGVVSFTNQTTFEAQGNILSQVNFDSLGPNGGIVSGAIGDLILQTSPYTAVIGTANASYHTIRNVGVSPTFSSLIFGVNSSPTSYTMVGFQYGFVNPFNHAGSAQISIITNLGTYNYPPGAFSAPSASSGLAFAGFVSTTPGEFITGFQVVGSYDSTGGGVGVTAIELGKIAEASPVPEPGTLALAAVAVALSIGRLGLRRRAPRA